RVVLRRVGVDRLVQAAVRAEVGLLVPFQAQTRHGHGPVHRALAYAREHTALANVQALAAADVEAEHAQARRWVRSVWRLCGLRRYQPHTSRLDTQPVGPPSCLIL